MTVSNKQLSIAIIVLFFAGILFYFFLWFGYIEIFANQVEVENFQVKSRAVPRSAVEKTYECTENPCRIKVRAGSKFLAVVEHPLLETKKIYIAKVRPFQTEKVVIPAKKELPEVEVKEIPKKSLSPDLKKLFGKESPENQKSFGPILTAKDGKFAIISSIQRAQDKQDFQGKLQIFIKTKSSEQLLTTITDEFMPIFLEKNFSLTTNGIIIPAKNRVYYYDFATQRKFKILEINSLRLSNISVSADGEEVVYYNLKTKKWEKISLNSDKPTLLLGDKIFFAGFWENHFLKITDNTIYLDGQEKWKIPAKFADPDQIYWQNQRLIIEKDFNKGEIIL